MPVDSQVQAFLEQLAAGGGPALNELEPPQARELFKVLAMLDGAPEEVEAVEDRTIPGADGPIPVRLYRPAGTPAGVLVWYHGGGWVIGDLDTADSTCRALANRSGAAIISVDYRLAPEHPHPAAVDDCMAALRWAKANLEELAGGGGKSLAVGGDSAGGNLAAVVAQRAAADGGPSLAFQLLVYPATDFTLSHPSMDENAEGYFLTRDAMVWFIDHYMGADGDPKDPGSSPLYAADVSGVPPPTSSPPSSTRCATKGEAYAERLREAGVPVEQVRYDGQIHGFFAMRGITAAAEEAVTAAGSALRRAFAS